MCSQGPLIKHQLGQEVKLGSKGIFVEYYILQSMSMKVVLYPDITDRAPFHEQYHRKPRRISMGKNHP